MFARHFYRVFLHEAKRHPFIKPQIKPFLNNGTRIFPISRSTVTGAYSTDPSVVGIEEGYNPKEVALLYFLDNKDKYFIVDTDNINLDETKSETLKLLKNLANDAEATKIPINVENLLEDEVKNCDLEDIFKFIILYSQLSYTGREKIWREFDTALHKRKFSLEELLKILFVMKRKYVKYRTLPKFTHSSVTKLVNKINRLDPHKVTQFFYEVEKLPPVVVVLKYHIQDTLMKTVPKLNAFELGLITERLRNLKVLSYHGLLEAIMEKTIKELENVDGQVLSKICRLLEDQLKIRHGPALLKFQEALIPQLPKFNQITLRTAVLSGSGIKCINSNFWNATIEYFKQNIDLISAKDIERMLFATTVYNIKDTEFLELLVEQFESKEGHQKNIECVLYVIVHLIHHGLFNEKLLGIICSENFASLYNPDNFSLNMKCAYMFINSSLIIEKPTPNFHQLYLPEKMDAFRLFRILETKNPVKIKTYSFTNKAMLTLEKLYGHNTTKIKKCLPYTKGILMRFDKNFRVQTFEEPPSDLGHYNEEPVKDGHRWLYVMIVPKTDFLYNSTTPTLQLQTKLRHLKIKGYEPLLVSVDDFSESCKSGKECELMKDLIEQQQSEGCNKE